MEQNLNHRLIKTLSPNGSSEARRCSSESNDVKCLASVGPKRSAAVFINNSSREALRPRESDLWTPGSIPTFLRKTELLLSTTTNGQSCPCLLAKYPGNHCTDTTTRLSQVCWSRGTGETCRTVAREDQDWTPWFSLVVSHCWRLKL